MKTKKTTTTKKIKKTKKPAKIAKSTTVSSTTKKTTVFTNGQSQAIRIPKEFRVNGKTVYIKKVGNCLMIIPIEDPWKLFYESLQEFSDDFMEDGREQPPMQERDWSSFK